MERFILHLKNCIAEIMTYLLFVMLEMAFFSYYGIVVPSFFLLSILALVSLYFYFIRVKIHYLWLFALLHLVPLAMIWVGFEGNMAYRLTFLVIATFQLIFSFGIRIAVHTDSERSDYGHDIVLQPKAILPFTLSVGMLIYFVNNRASIIAIVIALIVLSFFHLYMRQFLHYIDMSRRTTGNVPKKDILMVNLLSFGGFILLSVLLMALASGRDFLAGFGRSMINYLIRFINWVFLLLVFEGGTDEINYQATEQMLGTLPTSSNSKIGIVLENILISLVVLVLLALISGVIIKFIITIIKAFRSRAREGIVRNDGKESDVIEKLVRPAREKKAGRWWGLFRTNDEKIRRIFAEVAEKKAKESYPSLCHATARELLLSFGGDLAAELFVELYEKARYAQESCTADDVKMAKKLGKDLDNY